MFKPDLKKQVELKFIELFGRDHKVKVTGERLTPEQCAKKSLRCTTRDGLYLATLNVDGEDVASSTHRAWRLSYKLLKIEVEKLFSEGTSMF